MITIPYTAEKPPEILWKEATRAYQSGDYDQARTAVLPLVSLPGADGNVFFLAGLVESNLGNWKEAEKLLRDATSRISGNPDIWMAFGNALQNQGKAEAAVPVYQKALSLDRSRADALHNMGVAFEDMGRSLDAMDCYDAALAIDRKYELARRSLAPLLGRLRFFDRACECYEELIADFPGDRGLMLDYADFLELSNCSEMAEQYIPDDVGHNHTLLARSVSLRTKLMVRNQQYHDALSLLIDTRQRTGTDLLYFQEGKILDRLGNYEQAFDAFVKANQMAGKDRKFTRVPKEEVEAHIQKKIDSGFPGKPREVTEESALHSSPVFLVGLPRSGTTLLNRILNAHPGIQILEELEALRLAETILKQSGDVDAAKLKYWEIVGRHVQLEADNVVIDKSPYHAISLDVISQVFPEARVIMILRHPYDSALSCFMQDFAPGPINSLFLEIESCGVTCAKFLQLMAMFEKNRPTRVTRIQYENLVNNFDLEVGRILKSLDLEWDENIRNYADIASRSGPIMTSSYDQVTQKIYTSAINRWTHYKDQLGCFDQSLGPMLEDFGYGNDSSG